jgi:hypothetical protein
MRLTVSNTLAYYDSKLWLCVDTTDSIKHCSYYGSELWPWVDATDSIKHSSLLRFQIMAVGGFH